MSILLTKSKYLKFLTCPREFWLAHHSPELFPAPGGLEYDHRRQQGYAFEEIARRLAALNPDTGRYRVETACVFQTDSLFARADVVITDLATNELSIYEVKSSASVKEEHIHDVAFQKIVAEKTGDRVANAFVVTINTSYVRNGEVDVESICTVTNVTADVAAIEETTRRMIEAAFEYLETEPAREILGYCDSKLDCAFIAHHFPNLPEYSVFALGNLKKEKRDELIAGGVIDIRDIPDEFKLSDRQRRHVEVARSGQPYSETDEIKKRINALVYPLHFLDYETFNYAVPHYQGIRPYQQMAFQYSLHTIQRPGAECEHKYFLSRGDGMPPEEMARSLREAMEGDIGTVIVWSQGFEKTVNRQIGEMYPEFEGLFEEINNKTFDLRKIFTDLLYMHPEFRGSTSIKKVVPVLAPAIGYDDLAIGDGMTASILWFHMAKGTLDESERRAIYDNLRKYCHMDTWAMVEIFNFLKALS